MSVLERALLQPRVKRHAVDTEPAHSAANLTICEVALPSADGDRKVALSDGDLQPVPAAEIGDVIWNRGTSCMQKLCFRSSRCICGRLQQLCRRRCRRWRSLKSSLRRRAQHTLILINAPVCCVSGATSANSRSRRLLVACWSFAFCLFRSSCCLRFRRASADISWPVCCCGNVR